MGRFTERQLFNALRFGLRPEDTPDVIITATTPGKGNYPMRPHFLAGGNVEAQPGFNQTFLLLGGLEEIEPHGFFREGRAGIALQALEAGGRETVDGQHGSASVRLRSAGLFGGSQIGDELHQL